VTFPPYLPGALSKPFGMRTVADLLASLAMPAD
jgi:hypothetical protein